jgi:hypothetical protein
MKFKVGDVIKPKTGDTKYRICALLGNPSHYKMVRLDNGAVWMLLEIFLASRRAKEVGLPLGLCFMDRF